MDIFKILSLCLIVAVLGLFLKQYKGEYTVAITLSGGAIILILILNSLSPVFEEIRTILSGNGIDNIYLKIALKTLGIAYITEYAADTCRDCGQSAMAAKAELVGRVAVFIVSMPVLTSVLRTALKFAGE